MPGTTYQANSVLETFSVEVSLAGIEPTGGRVGSVLRMICVAIALSYNRGCTIAQWLRRSFLVAGLQRPEALPVSGMHMHMAVGRAGLTPEGELGRVP